MKFLDQTQRTADIETEAVSKGKKLERSHDITKYCRYKVNYRWGTFIWALFCPFLWVKRNTKETTHITIERYILTAKISTLINTIDFIWYNFNRLWVKLYGLAKKLALRLGKELYHCSMVCLRLMMIAYLCPRYHSKALASTLLWKMKELLLRVCAKEEDVDLVRLSYLRSSTVPYCIYEYHE